MLDWLIVYSFSFWIFKLIVQYKFFCFIWFKIQSPSNNTEVFELSLEPIASFKIIKLRREDFSPTGGVLDLDKNGFLKLRDKSLASEPDGICWLFQYHQVNQRGLQSDWCNARDLSLRFVRVKSLMNNNRNSIHYLYLWICSKFKTPFLQKRLQPRNSHAICRDAKVHVV